MVRDPKRRRMLLEAALKRFSTEGYHAATTRSIAADAEVSEVVLFRHFPSKRDLFLAVIGEFGPKELFRHVPADQRRGKWAADALRSLVIDYLETTWKHRNWLRALFQEAGRDREAAEALRGQYRGVGQALEAVFRDGVARGEFREDLWAAAMQVLVLAVRGFVGRCASRPPTDWEAERDEFVGNLMSVIIEGLRGKPSPQTGDHKR